MNKVELGSLKKHSHTLTESLRALRSNIQFCGDDIKTILFTSAMPDEGKSTVVMDLARSIAEAGKRVLVIDTDMRKSVLVGRLRSCILYDQCAESVSDFFRSFCAKSDGDSGKGIFYKASGFCPREF